MVDLGSMSLRGLCKPIQTFDVRTHTPTMDLDLLLDEEEDGEVGGRGIPLGHALGGLVSGPDERTDLGETGEVGSSSSAGSGEETAGERGGEGGDHSGSGAVWDRVAGGCGRVDRGEGGGVQGWVFGWVDSCAG